MITAEIYAEAKCFVYTLYLTRPYSHMAFRKLSDGSWLQLAWDFSVLSWSITPASEPLIKLVPGSCPNELDFPIWSYEVRDDFRKEMDAIFERMDNETPAIGQWELGDLEAEAGWEDYEDNRYVPDASLEAAIVRSMAECNARLESWDDTEAGEARWQAWIAGGAGGFI